MPRPLPALGSHDGALDALLRDEPCNSDLRKMVADGEEEREPALGEVRRGIEEIRDRVRPLGLHLPSLDHLTTLRGMALAEKETEAIAQHLRNLLAPPAGQFGAAQTQELERTLSSTLGPATRGDAMLQLLDARGQLDAQRLKEQYDFQRTLLASLDLLEMQGNQLGIVGFEGEFHPLPSLDAIQQRLRAPALRQKVAQGFDQLLLVPFGLPLHRLLDAWRRGLLRNEHLLQTHGGLNRGHPLWVWDGYEHDDLVYFPERFSHSHGGQTKAQLLATDPSAAWQVLLTEGGLADLPSEGSTLSGRQQLECGRAPRQYLQLLQEKGEAGWAPETYAIAFLTALERSGQVLDRKTYSFLAAGVLPASGRVPGVYWNLRNRRTHLGARDTVFGGPYEGARAAVRVV